MVKKEEKTTSLAARPLSSMTFPEMLGDPRVVGQLKRVLPKGMTPAKMSQIAVTVFRNSPGLQKCTPMSILSSLIECAQLGLDTDKTLGHAYLVPFKGECTMIAGYRGYMALAMRTGNVKSVWAEVVRYGDEFQVLFGTAHKIHHNPIYPQSLNEKDWVGAYACILYKDDYVDFEYVERDKVLAIRERSASWKSGNNSPWKSDPEWMWRKTAVRQLFHRVELSPEDNRVQKLALMDDLKEQGLAARNPDEIGGEAWHVVESGVTLEGPRAKEGGNETGASAETAGQNQPSVGEHSGKTGEGGGSNQPTTAPAPVASSPAPKSETPKPPSKMISSHSRSVLINAVCQFESNVDRSMAILKRIAADHGFAKVEDITVDKYDLILQQVRELKK